MLHALFGDSYRRACLYFQVWILVRENKFQRDDRQSGGRVVRYVPLPLLGRGYLSRKGGGGGRRIVHLQVGILGGVKLDRESKTTSLGGRS